jgi:hypothetical protein
VGAASAAAAVVLVLSGGTPGDPSFVQRADPATLRGEGAALRLPGVAFGLAWARWGDIAAMVTKPTGGIGFRVRIVDLTHLRAIGSVDVGARDVCGLTFRGPTLVALAADRPCYWTGARFAILRIDPRAGLVTGIRRIRGLHVAAPTNVAFGDGSVFVARPDGGVDAVDLATGATTTHRPRRAVAKGEDVVPASWLGDHLLAAGSRVMDVRTWRVRVLERGARGIVRAGRDLAAYGPRGVAVYTRRRRFVFRPIADPVFAGVAASGRYLYANGEVVDLSTHRVRPAAADSAFLLPP